MKPLHLAMLGAALAVAAMLYFLQGSARDHTRAGKGASASGLTRRDAAAGESETSKDTEEAETEGAFALTLVVVGPDGGAASGAELTLVGPRLHHATTERDGAGHFEGLGGGFYDLWAQKGAAVASRSFELKETTDLGTIRLAESVTIRGRVFDPRSRPVRGARVAAIVNEATAGFDFSRLVERWIRPDPVAHEVETGADGAYELRIRKGGRFALRVSAAGFAQEGEPARAYNSDTEGVDFHLFLAATVAGVVVDPEGRPVAGARVMVSDPMAIFGRNMAKTEVASSFDGTFALSIVPTRRIMLAVHAHGFALHLAPLTLPATDLRILLEPGVVLRLQAVDAKDAVPAPDVTAMVTYRGSFATGKTDEAGQLVLEHMPTKDGSAMGGQQQAFLTGGGYVPKVANLADKEPVDGVVDVGTFKLDAGGTVTGRVLDASTGEPIAGADVRAFGGMQRELQFLGATPAVSDEKGTFELTGVPLKASLLVAQHRDYLSEFNPMAFARPDAGKPLFPEGSTRVERDVRISRAAVVAGLVTDPSGNPVSGATITIRVGQEQMLMRMLGGSIPEAVSDKQGRFRLGGLRPNQPAKLVAKHREFGSSEPMTVRPGTGGEIVLALAEPIQLRGRVLDEQGRPLEGVRITVERARSGTRIPNPMLASLDTAGSTRPAVTDAEGEYVVRDAPAGDLVMSFDHPGYRPDTTEVHAQAGVASHDLSPHTLVRGPGIEGRVVDEAGQPVAGVSVTANATGGTGGSSSGRPWATTVTDKQGRFFLHGLREGDYAVQPYRQGSYGEKKTVRPDATGVSLVLSPAAELRGRVRANGRPVMGATVHLERTFKNEERLGWAQTDSAGQFNLTPLPPGETFTLVIEHDAFATRRIEGVAPDGPPRDFVLEPGVRIGGVVVDRQGQPVAHVQLRIASGDGSRHVRSGADGKWVAGGLGGGEISVELAAGSEFIRQDPIAVVAGEMNVRLVVERGESITGRVVGGREDQLRGIRVEAVDENGTAVATAWVWSNQRNFTLSGLPPGHYGVRAARQSDNEWQVFDAVERVATGTDDILLTLPE